MPGQVSPSAIMNGRPISQIVVCVISHMPNKNPFSASSRGMDTSQIRNKSPGQMKWIKTRKANPNRKTAPLNAARRSLSTSGSSDMAYS